MVGYLEIGRHVTHEQQSLGTISKGQPMGALIFPLLLWILGIFVAPAVNSAVTFSIQSGDGKKLSIFFRQFLNYIRSRQYIGFLAIAAVWGLTVAACYVLFSPKPKLPDPGIRPRYEFIIANCRIAPNERAQVPSTLLGEGFTGPLTVNNTDMPVESTASQRTVFFYQSTNQEAAQAIANLLKRKLGASYSVAHGDGFNIPQKKFKTIFAIHNIDDSCERK